MRRDEGRWPLPRTHFRSMGGSGCGGWLGGEGARGEGPAAGGRGGGAWAACRDPAWGLDSDLGGPRLPAETRRAGSR